MCVDSGRLVAILPPSGAEGFRACFVFHEVVGTMFAVIKTGGKQYRVAENDVIRVEKLAGAAGDAVQFDNVLMIGDKVGAPQVEGALVSGEVLEQARNDKIKASKAATPKKKAAPKKKAEEVAAAAPAEEAESKE